MMGCLQKSHHHTNHIFTRWKYDWLVAFLFFMQSEISENLFSFTSVYEKYLSIFEMSE